MVSTILFLLSYPVESYCVTSGGERSPETIALRKKISEDCEQLILDFFNAGGQVVIYDANNGTKERRQLVAEKFDKAGVHVVFLGRFRLISRA